MHNRIKRNATALAYIAECQYRRSLAHEVWVADLKTDIKVFTIAAIATASNIWLYLYP